MFGNTIFGGVLMEKVSSEIIKTVYDINNSQYEIVRIFSESKDLKSLITENISAKNEVIWFDIQTLLWYTAIGLCIG